MLLPVKNLVSAAHISHAQSSTAIIPINPEIDSVLISAPCGICDIHWLVVHLPKQPCGRDLVVVISASVNQTWRF